MTALSREVRRVYLLADFGKGPRVQARWEWKMEAPSTLDEWCCQRIMLKKRTARAWWLVECESADAGRALITSGDALLAYTIKHGEAGRILASGGAK